MDATTQAPIACAGCGAALAGDQRYCLHCGLPQGDARVAYRELIVPAVATPTASAPPPHAPPAGLAPAPAPRDWTPVIALGGLGALALVLVVGVLIGRSGTPTAASAPQVITVASGAPVAAAPAAATAVTEDWPADQDGFTVELGTLPKEGTTAAQVDAAKTAAGAKGATEVGVLDGDLHGAPESGSWVIYAGVFDTRKQAKKALGPLQDKTPEAAVLQVGGGSSSGGGGGGSATDTKAGEQAVQDLDSATGEDYQKKSSKLPDTVALPGKPPPKDDKAPGGGSGAETIG